MGMQLIRKIREISGLTNYAISKELNQTGVQVTIPGIDAYERPTARSMRLDVLCGLRGISGLTWNQFGKWLDEEFKKKEK